jgi:hypothetical protein
MELFRHKLIRALLGRQENSPRLVEIMRIWACPGFSVFQGEAIAPDDHEARRRLAGSVPEIGAGAARGRGRDVPLLSLTLFSFSAARVHACGCSIASEIGANPGMSSDREPVPPKAFACHLSFRACSI